MSFDAASGTSSLAEFNGAWGGGLEMNPFLDVASLSMPRTIPAMLRWCEFILGSQGVYHAAVNRIVSYFMTDVEVVGEDLSDDEQRDQRSYLVDQLQIMEVAKAVQMDAACYGNSFCSVIEPFTRYFACESCRALELTFDAMEQRRGSVLWEWRDFRMHATCPRCGVRGPWRMIDRRGGSAEITIKRWSPHEIRIAPDPYSGRNGYSWAIPETYRRAIRVGDFEALRACPVEVVDTIAAGGDLRFVEGYVFHGRSQTFAGLDSRGWGVPRVLTNYRQAYHYQVLNRANEAVCLDHVMPIRVVTPDGRGGAAPESADPILGLHQGDAAWRLRSMVDDHRRDPTRYHYWPFPIRMSNMGGDANQLAPFQLIDQALDTLLNAIDTPVDLYKMSLSSQDAPARLRLFEAVHREIPANTNRFLAFVMSKVAQYKDWPKGDAKLLPVTLVDDLAKDQYKQFLLQAGLISPQTATASVHLDAKNEYKKILEFQAYATEAQQKMQADMEAAGVQMQLTVPPVMSWMSAQQAAAQGAGGAPPAGGGAPAPQGGAPAGAPPGVQGPQAGVVPESPDEVLSRASQIAQQLAVMPESQKNQALKNIKAQAPLLHKTVTSMLRDISAQQRQAKQGAELVAGAAARRVRALFDAPPRRTD